MKSQSIHRYRLAEEALFRFYHLKPTEHFVKIAPYGVKVRVQVLGEGPPLVFIHGGPAAGGIWAPLVARLPQYQCLLLDRPGCGLSESIQLGNFSEEALIRLIVSVLEGIQDFFGLERAPLVASSFGAYLALQATLANPDRVTKLLLEGCPAMVAGSRVPFFMKLMLAPLLKEIVPMLPVTPSLFRQIMKQLGHEYSIVHQGLAPVFLDWYVSLFNHTRTQRNELSLLGNVMPAGKRNPAFRLLDQEIKRIDQPILWLWGMDDPFGGIQVGQRLHAQSNRSSLFIFDHSGHLPWLDQPENHAKAMESFLNQ